MSICNACLCSLVCIFLAIVLRNRWNGPVSNVKCVPFGYYWVRRALSVSFQQILYMKWIKSFKLKSIFRMIIDKKRLNEVMHWKIVSRLESHWNVLNHNKHCIFSYITCLMMTHSVYWNFFPQTITFLLPSTNNFDRIFVDTAFCIIKCGFTWYLYFSIVEWKRK